MKILVVKTSSLGDLLQIFPTISYLKERGDTIDWVVEKRFKELACAHPDINNVIPIDSKVWPKRLLALRQMPCYDLVIDLQGNCKSGLVTFLSKAKQKIGFTLKTCAEWPNALATNKRYPLNLSMTASEGYLQVVKDHFRDTQAFVYRGTELKLNDPVPEVSSDAFMVCSGSAWPSKQLSPSAWKKIEAALNAPIFEIAANQRLPLAVWQALMCKVKGVIALDSAALHLCATTNIPSFSIFGPSNPHVYKPKGDHHHSFWGSCPFNKQFKRRCPILRTCTAPCTKQIDEDALIRALNQWLIAISKN